MGPLSGDAGIPPEQRSQTNLQATSKQNRTQLEVAALEVVAHASATGKPMVMENLDFARKKAGMLKGERYSLAMTV